jgi:outer membrane protein assembly factor BamB
MIWRTKQMNAIEHPTSVNLQQHAPVDSATAPRFWPAVVLVCTFWGFVLITRVLDLPIFGVFMSNMGASALLALLFIVWWLTNRRIQAVDRLFGFVAVIVGGGLAAYLCDPSVGAIGVVLFGAPVSLSAWLLWLLLTKRSSAAVKRAGLLGLLALTWGCLTVVRVDGVWGDNNATVSWRWSRSAEDEYLTQRAQANANSASSAADDSSTGDLLLQSGDWPEFRGPNREAEVHGVTIAIDWSGDPPKQLWRNRIGPAWSSVLVIGDRLFTQEQRGESEVVVCLDAKAGSEIWSHQDKTRFSDGQAGAGPRATPTFSDSRIYSLGASGVLNCLDAASGKPQWSRNIVEDSGGPLPMWGFSSSPLITAGIVAVFAGGDSGKGLLAYRAATGEPAWTTVTGPVSYSSPQLASIDGQAQMLMLSDLGLVSVEPETGTLLWQYEAPASGLWRVVQPRQVESSGVLIGSEDLGLTRLEITHNLNSWTAAKSWSSKSMRPAYNDFVFSDGFVYGFDEGIFCCVDAQTGKRRWKAGRYGHGQVLLLADQRVLVVVSESGEAALVKASPDRHDELGRFQAVQGKTWNHPVIAHGRLYVRNDEEIACFELKLVEAP